MDEEFDPDQGNVNCVLDQESSELLDILTSQSPAVIMKLCQMMPSGSWSHTGSGSLSSVSAEESVAEHSRALLDYFRTADAAECRSFLQSVCMLCMDIPMWLESRLMSVSGFPTNDTVSSPSVAEEKSSSSPTSEEQLIKRPRIDYWEQYMAAVQSLLLRRWEQIREHLVMDVQIENVWVSLRTATRGRDRADKTPGAADRGSRTPESEVDYGTVESRVTLETFLQGCTGNITVLSGLAGSGKTLLMSCLGQQWARNLGPIPSSYLFVLLEFRQLNLLSRPVTLSELLLQHYLPPEGSREEKNAIVEYLLSNPERICWVLDGYDEFHQKITRKDVQRDRDQLDLGNPLPVADLISGLLHHQILPGCTVVVTCRVRHVMDLEGLADKVGQLMGWNSHEVQQYVDRYFSIKGHSGRAMQAAELLRSNRHLLAMSSTPALCNICCICLDRLLQGLGDEERRREVSREEEKSEQTAGTQRGGGSNTQREDGEERRRRNGGVTMDGRNGRAPLPPTLPQIPSTLTQVYLTVLGALLSPSPDKGAGGSSSALTQYRSELCELSQLAWRGLDQGRILFLENDIPRNVLEFSVKTGLFSKVELRQEDGVLVNTYCFIHLTVQELLAALRIMTSSEVSDAQLKKRFCLRTRWTTKSDQRTVFTDSLYLYVCGLASPSCTSVLVQLAKAEQQQRTTSWVQKRQELIRKLLKQLCQSNTLTGPKVLELCHCVQESQDMQLAKEVVLTRPILELRNIWLSPSDIDAVAFAVNSVNNKDIGLDFGACSMELECLDVLPRCQTIHYLSFHSRKYDDKFAEKVSSVLQRITSLRKLEFCGANLTATGAASLASALQNCPNITEINLSDNNLKDEGIKHIADTFIKLPQIISVKLGQNNTSLKAVDYLIRKISSCLNVQHIHANGIKEMTVTFSQTSDMNSGSRELQSEPKVSLLNQKWSQSEMQEVSKSLAGCPALSVLDLSGGQWDVETLRTLTRFIPRFNITNKIIVNDSCSSVEALVPLTTLLWKCPAVTELRIRLQRPVQMSVLFSGGRETSSKTLCLSCCDLLADDLERVWSSLGSSSDVTFLDLSHNCLGNKGLKELLAVLPRLHNIQEINVSNNGVSLEGAAALAGALCSHDNLTQIHISNDGQENMILKFCPELSDDERQLKVFRINHSSLRPSDVAAFCKKLVQCRSLLELDLSHSALKQDTVNKLLQVLPNMEALQTLNVSRCVTSTCEALLLCSCLSRSPRVASVELRLNSESFIHFSTVKVDQSSCRLTHFNLDTDELEKLLGILQRGPRLRHLDLSGNNLTDEGVKRFVDSLPRLHISRYVNLSNNCLTQQGLLDVASALSTCDSVCGVDVCLGAEGRSFIWFQQHGGHEKSLSVRDGGLERDHLDRLAEIMSNCPSLSKLEFRNSLRSEEVEAIVHLLSVSQRTWTISIVESWIRSDKAVSLLCRCLDLNRNIHSIIVNQTTLHVCVRKPAEAAAHRGDSAGPAPPLATVKIGLVDCAVQGYHLPPLRTIVLKCPFLTDLDLSHNMLGEAGAELVCSVLSSLPNLTSLSVGSKEPSGTVVEKLSEALVRSPTIQHLSLSGHVISDTAAQVMTSVLPRLRSLNLSQCVWSPSGGLQLLKALGQCGHLQNLCLDSPVHLDEDSRTFLIQSLRNYPTLRTLKLEGWRMADKGAEQLAMITPLWTDLRHISLSKNLIDDQSGVTVLEALRSCTALEELYLSSNSLGDLTAASMALVLPSLSNLSVIDISENHIGMEGSEHLSKAITYMKKLTKLNLTSVGTSELCAVAASLENCPLIQDVGLGWNNCGDNVALELARILPSCEKMIRLDLEWNSVSPVGAEVLLRALQSCPTLHVIRLWKNRISPLEAQRLSLWDRRLSFSST